MEILVILAALALIAYALHSQSGTNPSGSVPDTIPGPSGTPGTPIGPDGKPVVGRTAPKSDDPTAVAKDQFVLVKGHSERASFVRSLEFRIDETMLQDVETAMPNVTKPDPLASPPIEWIIYAVHKNRFPNVNPALVRAIIEHESSANPDAERFESNVNDYSVGLMQLRTDTAVNIGAFDTVPTRDELRQTLRDPAFNIGLGMKYLAWQQARYNDPTLFVAFDLTAWSVAAYNAGSPWYNFVQNRFGNQNYVDAVLALILRFQNIFPGG